MAVKEKIKVGTINAWPADKVERRAVADLIPYARNARTHSDAQVAQIAASVKEWGWTTPILIDEAGSIIAGHGRVMAARKLGLTDVPVMVATGWSEAQKKAYVLADNQLALNAGWDMNLLKLEISDLDLEGFDLKLTGFDPAVLGDIYDNNANQEEKESSTKEIDLNEFNMECKCPKCGFEFDNE
jgi:hypothetical protein